jgi:hydrogenase expression/formation protein HypE
MTSNKDFSLSCPIPLSDYPQVLLAHGGGGKLMHNLIEQMFFPLFRNDFLGQNHDSAVFEVKNGRLAFTSDSYVVSPLFFPGSDIGALAVNGTVNDLSMAGAKPLYISVSFILEEGLSMETLWKIVQSIAAAAREAGVQIVTGDTKVVQRGKGDGMFINTAGVGVVREGVCVRPDRIQKGDIILLNGDIGRHGICIMAQREGLEFEVKIESDCAPLNGLVQTLLDGGVEVHCLRDLTRGGLGGVVVELAQSSRLGLTLEEVSIPICEEVKGACEILGFDPLYVANEGRLIAFIKAVDTEKALKMMRTHPVGKDAAVIGQVDDKMPGIALLRNSINTTHILDMISGEQLPRIC